MNIRGGKRWATRGFVSGLLVSGLLVGGLSVAHADGGKIEIVRGTTVEQLRPGESPGQGESSESSRTLPSVEVFVTDWCPYCQRLEAFLKENGVPYTRKNIEEQERFREEHSKLGGGGIPVTLIDGTRIVRGFSAETMTRALGLDAN